jgi:four helix bundle protein
MKEQIKNRTKQFAIDCWMFCKEYPKSREFDAFCRQLIRCSSSVASINTARIRQSKKSYI